MRICIVGGGHIGTALLCYVKNTHPEYIVSMYTRRPKLFNEQIICNDWEGEKQYSVTPDVISDQASVSAKDADIVFIAAGFFGSQSYVTDSFGVQVNDRANVATEEGKYQTSYDEDKKK